MTGFRLLRTETDRALVEELAARHHRVGLDGLRRSLPRFALRVPPRADAETTSVAWDPLDQAARWWPQGIDAEPGGRAELVVTWYAPLRRGRADARVTLVDLRGRFPRYRHVLLVDPVRGADGAVRMAPVPIHAGGVAWHDGRLLVAAASGGIREFVLDDVLALRGARRPGRGFGGRHVLPQSRAWRIDGAGRPKFSFISVDLSQEAAHLVAGEYSRRDGARLLRFPLLGDADTDVTELHVAGIRGMQGAAIAGGRWFVTVSTGARANGDLLVGDPAGEHGFRRHVGVLPPGPEDLALAPDGRLWSHTEWPWRRRIFALDPSRWPGPVDPGATAQPGRG